MIVTLKYLYKYHIKLFWVEYWGKLHKVKYLEKLRILPGGVLWLS